MRKRKKKRRLMIIGWPSVGSGMIHCRVPGLQLIDFYRTESVLAKDVESVKEKHE